MCQWQGQGEQEKMGERKKSGISYSQSLRESCDAHAFITQFVIFFQKIKDIGILRPINHILRTQSKSLTEKCLLSKAACLKGFSPLLSMPTSLLCWSLGEVVVVGLYHWERK